MTVDVFRVQIRSDSIVSLREIREALYPVFGEAAVSVWRVIPEQVELVKSDCDVCDALGLGPTERENAHPHRLIEVLRVEKGS